MKTTTRILIGLVLFSLHAHGMELRDLGDPPPPYQSRPPSPHLENQELQSNEPKKEPLFPRCIPDKGVPKPERIGDIVKFDLGPTPNGENEYIESMEVELHSVHGSDDENSENEEIAEWQAVYDYAQNLEDPNNIPVALLHRAINAHVHPAPSEANVWIARRSCFKRFFGMQPTMPDLTFHANNVTGIPNNLTPAVRRRIREEWLFMAEEYIWQHHEEFDCMRTRRQFLIRMSLAIASVFMLVGSSVGNVFIGLALEPKPN